MSKTFKVIIIALVIILAIGTITSNAASINMNLESGNTSTDNVADTNNTTDTNTQASNEITNSVENATNSSSSQTDSDSSSPIVTNVSSLPESELGLTNIINILLIAVGVILIFLAIAILIRLARK